MRPQDKKRKSLSSLASQQPNPNDTAFFEAMMSDPIKRKLVLELLSQEKDAIAKYKENEAKKLQKSTASPLKRVKKVPVCESPTALMRRRALEKQQQQDGKSTISDRSESKMSERSQSRQSDCHSPAPSPVPFENLLNGVIAYVEIKSKDIDRSAGAKALMSSMGAVVREKFTSDVTHVIFKDGSFTTYQKAKLMKVHMVSVLWLEAVRRSHTRVPERDYPALGTESFDNNISTICSQLQKEYEEVVREDIRRSLALGTPLPSTKSLLTNRRRTIMTPAQFSSSFLSERFSQELPTSTQDREVDTIMSKKLNTITETSRPPSLASSILASPSPEITSDESDCGIVNGDYNISKKRDNILLQTSEFMEVNDVITVEDSLLIQTGNKTSLSNSDMLITPIRPRSDSISDTSKSLLNTIGKSNRYPSEMEITCSDRDTGTNLEKKQSSFKKSMDLVPSDKSTNISTESVLHNSLEKNKVRNKSSSRKKKNKSIENKENSSSNSIETGLSNLQISTNTPLMENNSNQLNVVSKQYINKDSSDTNMSTLQIYNEESSNKQGDIDTINNDGIVVNNETAIMSGSNITNLQSVDDNLNKKSIVDKQTGTSLKRHSKNSTETNMSSLRISGCSDNKDITHEQSTDKNISKGTTSTSMSSLQISCDHKEESNLPGKTNKATDFYTNRNVCDDQRSTKQTGVSDSIDSDCSNTKSKDVAEDQLITKRSRRSDILSSAKKPEVLGGKNESSKQLKNRNTSTDSPTGNISTNSSEESSTNSSSSKTKRRVRKLYNPDESIQIDIVPCDEDERLAKRKKVKRKLEEDFLDPNVIQLVPIVLTARARRSQKKKYNYKSDVSLNSSKEEPPSISKPKKRYVKKTQKEQPRFSSADEQKDLASEFLSEKPIQKTFTSKDTQQETNNSNNKDKVDTFKTPGKSSNKPKKVNTPNIQSQKSPPYSKKKYKTVDSDKAVAPSTPLQNRRSTMEFQPQVPLSSTKKKPKTVLRLPSIVCTKLHKDECIVFHKIVKKLGGFVIEDEVSSRTTHLVAGESKRTINMLRAIARGCWILKHEWLLLSLEHGKWLPEEDYEVTDFSPAVRRCRLEHQAFGSSYSMDIFADCGPIYIAPSSTPRCSDLKELVTLCKGTITNILRNSKIVVAAYIDSKEAVCVTETWILDCITFNKKKSFKKYLIKASEMKNDT